MHDLKTEAGRALRLVQGEWRAIKEDPSRKQILIEGETNLVETVRAARFDLMCLEDAVQHHQEAAAMHNREKDKAKERIAALRAKIAEALYPIGKITVDNKPVIPSRSPDSVEITDKALIPDELMKTRTVKEPDKTAIKKALENGETVPGAELITGKVKVAL